MPNGFQRFLAKLAFSEDIKSALPWSVASEDETEIAFSDTTYFQNADGKKELEILYRNNWLVKKCVNIRANLLSFRGMKIVCKGDPAKKATNDLLKRMHPTRPMLAIQNSFKNRSIDIDIFGNSFDELLYLPAGTPEKPIDPVNATSLNGWKKLHPINIDFQRTMAGRIKFKNNIPLGWDYKKDPRANYKKISLPLKRIAHCKYNQIGDELLGMSSIEPVFKSSERMLKIEEGITQGILTHGNPLHDVIVGDETHPPTKKMIDSVSAEVKGLNSKSEYAHPPWIRVGQIESFSLGKAPNYLQPYWTAICSAFEVPEFIGLGRGEGTNKATAQVMVNFIHQTIQPLQQIQAMYFEEEILAPLMKLKKIDEVPTVEWNDILPKSVTDYANIVKVLSEAMVGGKQIITFEEARELAGLDTNITFKKPTGSELAETKGIPGIYLTEPHGKLIWEGQKKLIVKSKAFTENVMTPLYLISGNKVFGIIKLRDPKPIDLEDFASLQSKHKISDKERSKWWPNKHKLFAYEFNFLKKFEEPKHYDAPQGVQVFIKEVKL